MGINKFEGLWWTKIWLIPESELFLKNCVLRIIQGKKLQVIHQMLLYRDQ